MDKPSSSKRSWILVIEALASYKEYPIHTLQALIDAAPVTHQDFSQNAMEFIALRCLEELASYSSSSTLDSSTVPLDSSRTCLDVVDQILDQVPLSNLNRSSFGAVCPKWDLNPFIMHKRATKMKCQLEKMKDSILDGTLQLPDKLKEKSGLFPKNRANLACVNEGKRDDRSVMGDGNSTYVEDMGAKENSPDKLKERSGLFPTNRANLACLNEGKRDRLVKGDGNSTYAEDMGAKENSGAKETCVNEGKHDRLVKGDGNSTYVRAKETCVNEGKHDRLVKGDGNSTYVRAKETCVNEGKRDRLVNGDGNSTYAEDMGAKENLACLLLKDDNKASKNQCLSDKNRLCSKRTRVDLTDENSGSCLNEKEVCIIEYDEFLRSTKKIKRNSIEKQVSRLGKEVSENSIEEIQICKNVGHHSEMNNTETLCDGSLEDIHSRCTTSKLYQSSGQHKVIHGESDIPFNTPQHTCEINDTVHVDPIPLNDGNTNNNQHMTNQSQPQPQPQQKKPNVASSNVSQKPVASDKDVVDIVSEAELSSDSDVYHNGYIALTTKKDGFLRSRHTFCQPRQKKPNVAFSNVSQKPVASDKGVVDTVSEAELSSDSDMYHNEEIALTAKKAEFLRSRHAFGQDLPAMTESTGQNLCIKCNEAGQLLFCQTSTCSLMMHKNCLGDSAQLDGNGNFLCPFCEYSRTISEYLEAKKSASLAKKQLAIFKSKGKRN